MSRTAVFIHPAALSQARQKLFADRVSASGGQVARTLEELARSSADATYVLIDDHLVAGAALPSVLAKLDGEVDAECRLLGP